MKELLGTGVALVTPFSKDLSVDYKSLINIVNYNIENGIDYLVISGTTGESATITKNEKQEIISTIVKINNGRLPLVLGIGGNNTASVLEEIKQTDLRDFTAILSVSPYYTKPTQEGLYAHYKAISESSPVPIILYNVPGRTSKNMEVSTILKLAENFENIVAVKEAGNNMHNYYQLLKDKPKDFMIISGDDDLALGVVLAGGSGVISVLGQAFPKAFSAMIKLGLEGRATEAYKCHFDLLPITSLIFEENNPAGIKQTLASLNLCEPNVRLPLVRASNELKTKIDTFVKQFNS